MKKIILSVLAIVALSFSMWAQSPEAFKYQAVVRDASQNIIPNQAVGMRLTIMQGSTSGTVVYQETFAPTSNSYGLVNLEIGTGTVVSGTFASIDWANGPYFIETAMDATGGTSYVVMGASQLVSVPYALYSKMAGSAVNDSVNDADADPTNEYNTSVVLNGDSLEITDLGGTIKADLSSLSGGSSNWTVSGNNIYNSNAGLVGVGFTNPMHTLAVGKTDTTTALAVGFVGSFNNAYSGKLVFSEDLSFNGDCGLMFQHNGSTNNLHLMGGCTTFGDTIARFNRSGFSNIKRLRLGNNILTNATNPLSVNGNSDFTGDMTITGNLNVTGNIAKGGGTFKIDHPLDPANKYLVHSFVESPEMMNIYSGNIVTDANGYATVELPSYFEAANKDFRYQLTVIGTFAQAIIKEKISNNKFIIQTNQPNTEVSWSVTGIRADKYANANRVEDEVEKELKGTYIHPELYGATKEQSETAVKEKIILDKKEETNDLDK
ncbi:MAG: hypothetical protein OQJ96_02635 [Flavobacteriales bacterium]|nr:hypothetical protein [Flavobacteriales bacterium]MCW8912821.1 hypothetical protein [Flavobacteriales bacterium]MCW8938825.1 hypothetical protein [Flavobacteriales bacterium]MCW8939259.1 hypothetical protein [Flavobacteriales bacterium]MCW8968686.1 hypothetical protein [Flavobacteriales bacterium]